jgi:hypothetical protein
MNSSACESRSAACGARSANVWRNISTRSALAWKTPSATERRWHRSSCLWPLHLEDDHRRPSRRRHTWSRRDAVGAARQRLPREARDLAVPSRCRPAPHRHRGLTATRDVMPSRRWRLTALSPPHRRSWRRNRLQPARGAAATSARAGARLLSLAFSLPPGRPTAGAYARRRRRSRRGRGRTDDVRRAGGAASASGATRSSADR